MNDKKRIVMLLKIFDQIQQHKKDARNEIEKTITAIWKKEGILVEQVFYILYFDAAFISNKSPFSF